MKRTVSIIIALFIAITFTPFFNGETFAASKPGKVKGFRATPSSTSVVLKWKKAKKAKKYQVYVGKSKVKTLKARKYKVKKLKAGKKYTFKVRAINGKNKGKFAKKVVKTKGRNSSNKIRVEGDENSYKLNSTFRITSLKLNKPNEVNIKWSKPKVNHRYFRILYKRNNENWKMYDTETSKSRPKKNQRNFKFYVGESGTYSFAIVAEPGGAYCAPKTIKVGTVPTITVNSIYEIKHEGTYNFPIPHDGKRITAVVETVGLDNRLIGKYNGRYFRLLPGKFTGKYTRKSYDFNWDYKYFVYEREKEYENYGYSVNTGRSIYTKSKRKDVEIRWTCDGTDPANVTKDVYGHCKYTGNHMLHTGGKTEKELIESGYYKGPDGEWYEYIDTTLRGVTKYGKPRIIFPENTCLCCHNIFWIKVYKNGKLIGEEYTQRNFFEKMY